MRNQGLGSWIERRARMSPERVALVAGDRSWTYGELATHVAGVAGALEENGVRWGDRVCYVGPNHPAALTTAFAAGLLGAVYAPLSHRRPPAELQSIVADAGCAVVLYGPDAGAAVAALRERTATGRFVAAADPVDDDPTLNGLVEAAGRREPPDLPVGLGDLCFLLYTSGTTGPPKAVMLTHGNVTWNVVNFHSASDFHSRDVTLAITPLHRSGGWGVTLLPTLHKGGTIVLPPTSDPAALLRLIGTMGVTTLFGGPELLGGLAASSVWEATDLSSLRLVISGGDVVHEPLLRTYLDRGVRLLQGYGLTEASPMCLMIDEADALRRPGSAGVPPMHTTVRVARPDLTDASPGEIGELVVRGPNVMRGYWRRPEETEKALAGGWLHTGDAGRVDDEGYFYIVDRMSHAFSAAGQRVYPVEIERVLVQNDAVAEAAVVATPHPSLGQAGVAFIVLRKGRTVTEDELLTWGRARLAPHVVPVAVHIVQTLPRNAAGKVLRAQLRAA